MRLFFLLTLLVGGSAGPALCQPLTHIPLADSATVIGYGDMRFTNPKEKTATNPKVRKWLVDKIAEEKPAAILLSGDVPWHGQVAADYAQYAAESKPWRDAHIFVSPALGNHELNGDDPVECLENWWNAFPELRGHRWYSTALGDKIYVLNLDSNSPLVPGSEQLTWIQSELASLPPAVKFVFLNLHHPPVADLLEQEDHNPRPNEIALAKFLNSQKSTARFIVLAGHIHNYERFHRDGVIYLVSGGGGAKPRVIPRAAEDLYKDAADVNYHYIKFVLRGDTLDATMIRVADPSAKTAAWEVRDRFTVTAR
jgi:hypothetical protein